MAVTLKKWIDDQQARGKYTFVRAEAIQGSGLSPEAIKKALQRLERRRRVMKAKNYFYVVVPLEYLSAGAPPASWFIHDLMTAMRLPYYVGLLSAAGLHGASLQQPQEFQVVTDRSVRTILAGRQRLRFIASKYIRQASTVNVKTPTGSMRVSTPETTVVDLVRFAKVAGHLDHVAAVIAELSPSLNPRKLLAALRLVGDLPNAQRTGYILDLVRARQLSDPIHAWLERQGPRPVPLRTGHPVARARENRRWRVLVNGELDVER
ncbi:MAG TPA: type IV toxin-antitoxin system AbiEi family antitoxin [Phycisphaerae bacterium]|nr:type IV toxin-antitoxin system AbiEi family antitoxin [Phycisphaerae bacterium]HRY67860.1 type IV toxin-antitoxin system AbiEi family antitoxin [Phycisphaerae bacterium]HSA25313.1 type IV toxin-antitoxin system AbiEi family antitoxin [Phycisphaerae bacterium]